MTLSVNTYTMNYSNVVNLSFEDKLRATRLAGYSTLSLMPADIQSMEQSGRTLADIRTKTNLRIVTGEKQCGLPHFEETLAANAADILNPDIAAVGGILDMAQISE